MTRVRAARVAGLLAVAVSVPLVLSACSGDDPPAASPTGSASRTGAAGPPPPVDTATPSAATTTLPARKVGQTAKLTGDVEVSVAVKEASLEASGPGEVAGAGVVVRLRVRNAGTTPFDLTTLAVNATYGKGEPASPTDSAGAPGLRGSLAAGESVTGVYAFKVPKKQAKTLKLDITSSDSANIVIFRR